MKKSLAVVIVGTLLSTGSCLYGNEMAMADNKARKCYVYTHRGDPPKTDENSIRGWITLGKKGIGADGDIQVTADGVPVLYHDYDVKQQTNGIGLVKDLTFAKISTFRYDKYGSRIPSLDAMLKKAHRWHMRLNLEVKQYDTATSPAELDKIIVLLRKHRMVRSTMLYGNPALAKALKNNYPGAQSSWMVGKPWTVEQVKARSYDAVLSNLQNLTRAKVAATHRAGIPVYVRRGNRAVFTQAWKLGVDGAQSDQPYAANSLCKRWTR